MVCSLNPEEKYYLVEVIAFVLKHLRDKLNKYLSMKHCGATATDMDWAITVPAIWKPAAKQVMREAAYLV